MWFPPCVRRSSASSGRRRRRCGALEMASTGNNLFGSLLGSGPVDDEEPQYLSAGPSLYDRARSAVGMPSTRTERAIDTVCPSMTFKQRCYGFGIAFVIGCLLSFGSVIYFHQLLAGRPAPFAINYTLGNLIALSSTCFLMGPKTQLKRMASPTRWLCALVYVCAMAATLVCALLLPSITDLPQGVLAALVLGCLVVQFLAMFWYALSYIPYGRRMFKACCVSVLEEG